MKKYALAIHHVNVAYAAGNELCYHRQVREGIIPLINLLKQHPDWCFTLEMAGFSLEFIRREYPGIITDMRHLIETGQIELISCTYSPQIWINFPKLDLVRSIEHNLELLDKYNLKASRIFFTQENFFGPGIIALKKYFDLAVIKDDYFFYFHQAPEKEENLRPYYLLNDMKIIVGWGHILEGLANYSIKNELPEFINPVCNSTIKNTNDKKHFLTGLNHWTGSHNNVLWKWYHIGSSERLAKPVNKPQDIVNCYFNREWFERTEKFLQSYTAGGYQFAKIQTFINSIDEHEYQPVKCPPLIDGSWNMAESRGSFIWMGYNSTPVENDLVIRNHNWRSRSRLVGAETALDILKNELDEDNLNPLKKMIKQAWQNQLLAEISDSTGWWPDAAEVSFSIKESEKVLNILTNLITELYKLTKKQSLIINTFEKIIMNTSDYFDGNIIKPVDKNAFKITQIEFVNACGHYQIYEKIRANEFLFIVELEPDGKGNLAGIQFPLNHDSLVYSPALLEDRLIHYDLGQFLPDQIYFSNPNGLIGIADNVFLIKHNEFTNIAYCIDKKEKKVNILVGNPKKNRMVWMFSIITGNEKKALQAANRINVHPQVVLI